MTISRLNLKVSELAIALGTGASEDDLVAELWQDGYPRPIINKMMQDAKDLFTSMVLDEKRMEQEKNTREVQALVQELILMEDSR
jgi:hypothetical protein